MVLFQKRLILYASLPWLTGEIMNYVFENTPILNLLVYVDWNGHKTERFD